MLSVQPVAGNIVNPCVVISLYPLVGSYACIGFVFLVIGVPGDHQKSVFRFQVINHVGIGADRSACLVTGKKPVDEDEDSFVH